MFCYAECFYLLEYLLILIATTVCFIRDSHFSEHTKTDPQEAIKVPLRQKFRLQSACGTPKYTNFTAGFADCLDYIYYEAENFEVVQVVPFPSPEELTQNTALPSIVFPSDHIALISDIKWK